MKDMTARQFCKKNDIPSSLRKLLYSIFPHLGANAMMSEIWVLLRTKPDVRMQLTSIPSIYDPI